MKYYLLIDEKPESCETCPLRSYSNLELICTPMREGASDVKCPLKPLPEKLYIEANRIEDVMPSEFDIGKWTLKIKLDTDKIFAFGWNKCLEELENESNISC